jgi:hypothetical protein
MLKQFGHEIWIANGSEVAVLGFRYPTRMAVIRLSGGGLLIWSPITLTNALRAEVNAFGEVRHIVAPNSLHHLFAPEWKRAYPSAKVYAPPGLREKRKDIEFAGDLGNAPIPDWAGEIDQALMLGNLITTEVVFFHVKSGTVLFADLIQQFPPNWFSGWRAFVARMDLMAAPEPSVPSKIPCHVHQPPRRACLVGTYSRMAAKKVLMAHGTPVTDDGNAFMRRAFRWLIA